MNFNFPQKLPSLVLLLVMLLNPILGLAGTLFLSENEIQLSQTVQSPTMAMSEESSENCHDHGIAGAQSDNQTQNDDSECCEVPCMCGQSGCHSPLAATDRTSFSFSSTADNFVLFGSFYINPSLSSLTPPPII